MYMGDKQNVKLVIRSYRVVTIHFHCVHGNTHKSQEQHKAEQGQLGSQALYNRISKIHLHVFGTQYMMVTFTNQRGQATSVSKAL